MRIICAIAGHRRGPRVLRNSTVEFARCRRCGCDLVRRKGAAWKEPAGYRIKWPAGLAEDVLRPRSQSGRDTIKLPDGSQGAAGRNRDGGAPGPVNPVAGRQNIARISLYRPGPNEPDFMEDDEEDLFWDVPIAVHAAFLRKTPRLSEFEAARIRRRRRR